MMLIKVTAGEGVGPCWINGDYIVSIRKGPTESSAIITMTNGNLVVSESMDEVVDMLEGRDEDGEEG